ncbi:GroES-like protein [Dendrothele bispora CBS 962.96]|uniref:GroES-like protein n=1 Tax=Dendrothele bispora (strain CBS 962.96) TaxID=1314807 RepID=A0A4S8MTQ4_DENBC|nr:GroES-like protein [Dendrothele bispora CBS 962.96]
MSSDKTHAAIATTSPGHFTTIQVPTPATPDPGQVLIKVEYASMIILDTYINDLGHRVQPQDYPVILGFNGAGTIMQVGEGIDDLKVGDRVTAVMFGKSERKAMQEYVVQPRSVVAKIPSSLPLSAALSAAATIPDNFITAFSALFSPSYLGFPYPSFIPSPPPPSDPSTTSPSPPLTTPILIYGAGTTTGQYAIQLLHATGYTSIFATSSPKHHPYLLSLGASHVFDYRSPTLAADILLQVTPKGSERRLKYVLDCVTAEATLERIAQVVDEEGGSKVALLLPIKKGDNVRVEKGKEELMSELPEERNPFPKGTKHLGVRGILFAEDPYLRANLLPKILPHLLDHGIIQPNKVRLLDESFGTLEERVGKGLELLRNNLVSGEKVVVKIQ